MTSELKKVVHIIVFQSYIFQLAQFSCPERSNSRSYCFSNSLSFFEFSLVFTIIYGMVIHLVPLLN